MLDCMEHSILVTWRWCFSISFFSPFYLQMIIWNVGRCGSVSWVLTSKGMASVMSSGFTIPYIVSWLFACTEILCKYSCALFALLWFLCFRIWRLEIQWGNIFNVVQQTRITDVCKLVIFFFNTLLHFHDQIIRSEIGLQDICRM